MFIRNIALDDIDAAMVRSIIEVARIMGKDTVAEFVENRAQYELRCRLGVDFVQGYFIGKPRPLDEVFESLMRSASVDTPLAVNA